MDVDNDSYYCSRPIVIIADAIDVVGALLESNLQILHLMKNLNYLQKYCSEGNRYLKLRIPL
jgi:hypothetical protein